MSYKPESYNSVSPYIMVDDARAVIDFLDKTFGITAARRFDNPDGSIGHVEIKIDDTVVMLADAGEGFSAFPVWLHVYVDDVDVCYQKALAAGGEAVQEPVQKEGDPDKRGGVKDPSGNTWWISTQVDA